MTKLKLVSKWLKLPRRVAVDLTTLGGRGSSVPSLHTRNDFLHNTASANGSPIDPGDVVDWRTIGEAFASYVVPVQDALAKAELRPDRRGTSM